MVDIHSHFLCGIDDGARDFEMSVSMLRMAAENGTTDIVATPHSDLSYRFQPDEIERQISRLSTLPGLPRLHRGCDFHLSFDNIQDCFEFPSKYTVNGRNYLLVEFHNMMIPAEIDEVFRRMAVLGITPIITHPERNPILAKQPERLAHWVSGGCRVQITAQSLSGRFGRQAVQTSAELLNAGIVHFVASDAHDLENRPPLLRPAYEEIAQDYGEEIAHLLFAANPTAVLTGDPVRAQNQRMTKPHRWFKLW